VRPGRSASAFKALPIVWPRAGGLDGRPAAPCARASEMQSPPRLVALPVGRRSGLKRKGAQRFQGPNG
jgi:hypothetical protein